MKSSARLRSAVRPVLEQLEGRRLFAASTPFTADGQPWQIDTAGQTWVEAENYDYGGPGVAYSDTTPANQGGAYRIGEGVDLEGPSAPLGNTFNIGYVNPGEWTKYTVNVAKAGTYVVDLRASNANGGAATAHVTFTPASGTVASTGAISVPPTGAWATYVDHTATVTLAAGTQTMTVYDDAGGCNYDYIGVTPTAVATAAEQAYNPTTPDQSPATLRGLPTYVPAFGAASVEAEDFDTGGQAAAATGVQSGGYYWSDASKYTTTYPYTSTPFRPADTIDLTNGGTGIVVTHWLGGNWAQYTVDAAANVAPVTPGQVSPAYQAVTPTATYQLIVTYSNSSAGPSNFALADTSTDPATGVAALTQLASLSLPATGGAYQTVTTTITLPRTGLNALRLIDADAAGVNGQVNVDSFRLINSTTRGNGGVPWDVPTSGTTTHIPADDYDVAPGSATFTPTVAPTADVGGGNDVLGLTAGNALSYTVNAEQPGKYNLALRVANTGTTAATVQVTFDSGASFGGAVDPVAFAFTVPAGSGYQTVTTATNTGENPRVTAAWVEAQKGVQKMQVKVLSGTVTFHYAELSAFTATAVVKPDPNELGSYAADPPTAALESASDTFDRVYDTKYYWINPPANAPVPTNDWWTSILVNQFAGDLYAYPEKINDSAAGVAVSGFAGVGTNSAGNSIIPTGQQSIAIGAAGTAFTDDALLDYGDWTVHYRMETATAGTSLDVTTGRGLPYTWFEFNGGLTPTVTLHAGSDATQAADTVYDASGNVLTGAFTADHFRVATGGESIAVFAPAGTTFTPAGNTYTVTFAAGVAHYLVTAVLPDGGTATLNTFYQHAYAVPRQVGGVQSSTYTWTYSPTAGTVTTHWALNLVPIDPAHPPATLTTIQGWLPLDYTDGATGPAMIAGAVYPSLNGNIELSVGSSFDVAQTSLGINFDLALPQTIGAPTTAYDPSNPATTTVSTDYSPQQMLAYVHTYVAEHTNAAATAAAGTTILTYGNDTYFGAKPLQEYAEFALMTKQMGDTADYNIFLGNLTTFMTDWFTYTPGESAHFFAYYPGTGSLTGFDPAYGSEDFTDNHFHYGYFTAAAGVLALLNPTWAAQYGSIAKTVAMQYANWLHTGDPTTVPDAPALPFLRTFEPWVGHSYAGGTSSPGGNNQESTSEAIQSWLGIALLGQALNDPAMTAAGMMGYTVESKAVREQWFNQAPGSANPNGLAFPSTYADPKSTAGTLSNVAIDFDGGKSYATYFGANPEYILGIEALPIWPSLDFLGENAAAAQQATASMLAERAAESGNPADATFASFEINGENDWLNIALGYQSQYDPQATALQYARMIVQQTPTGETGTTGLYYFQDHAGQTYGLRNWTEHLSVPLGGVYSHGADATTMSNTTTYMAYNPGTTPETVYVYDASDAVIDSFTAAPGFNAVTRAANGVPHAPPILVTAATASPATVTGTTTALAVLGTDETQTESNLTYAWTLTAGPAGAKPAFSANSSNAAKNTTVTFNEAGSYTFTVTATDVTGLTVTTTVDVTVATALVSVTVTPTTATVITGATQTFAAAGVDQFGNAIASPAVTWRVTAGGGTITAAGVYTAPGYAGPATITATSGAASASATVTVGVPIAAPTNVTATDLSPSEIDLSWTAPSGTVLGYDVYRSTTPGGEGGTPLNAALITGTSFRDTAVAAYTSYFYLVRTVGSGGPGTPSIEASATTAADLALNRPAFSFSNENAGVGPTLAVDGNSATRWSSGFTDPNWIYVNLGSVVPIGEVKLNWEAAAGKNYLIQVSSDAVTWRPVVTVVGNTAAGWHDYPDLNTSGQYVRMYGTVRDSPYGYSLLDLNVYGVAAAAVPVALIGGNYVSLDPTVAGQVDVWSGTTNAGAPAHTYPAGTLGALTDTAATATDALTVDFAYGNPLLGGATFAGVAGGANAVVLKGDSTGDTYAVAAGAVNVSGGAFATVAVRFTNAAAVSIVNGGGTDAVHQLAASGAAVSYLAGTGTAAVAVDAGALTLVAPATTGTATLSTLSVGGRVTFAAAAGRVGRSVLVTSGLTFGSAGTLDLGGNDLLVHAGSLSAITAAVRSAYDAGRWDGLGLTSSAAAVNRLLSLGVALNVDPAGNRLYGSGTPLGLFDGQNPAAGDVLVRYTLFGDANLDGHVDGTDYADTDAGYAGHGTGWASGDFNYDGLVDGSDYTLIDNAFNAQPL